MKVGAGPDGVGVDDLTHTIYVANNNADGDHPGTVSVLNGATCSGANIAGCAPIATVAVGRSPLLAAIDTTTDHVYVTNYSSATVSIIDGSTCNAADTTGCSRPAAARAVGSQPFGLAIDTRTNTVYAFTEPGPGAAASIFEGLL